LVICGVVVEAVACIDDSAYSLSLVTYDKRFFLGVAAASWIGELAFLL